LNSLKVIKTFKNSERCKITNIQIYKNTIFLTSTFGEDSYGMELYSLLMDKEKNILHIIQNLNENDLVYGRSLILFKIINNIMFIIDYESKFNVISYRLDKSKKYYNQNITFKYYPKIIVQVNNKLFIISNYKIYILQLIH
jgi:hypothetical protein